MLLILCDYVFINICKYRVIVRSAHTVYAFEQRGATVADPHRKKQVRECGVFVLEETAQNSTSQIGMYTVGSTGADVHRAGVMYLMCDAPYDRGSVPFFG